MAVRPASAAERERIEEATERLLAAQSGPLPLPLNSGVLAYLVRERMVPLRDRIYRVPPISVQDGALIYELLARLEQARHAEPSVEAVREVTSIYVTAVEVIRSILRPTGWRRFLPRRWSAPPSDLTEYEIGWLLGFLSVCRMTPHPAEGGRSSH